MQLRIILRTCSKSSVHFERRFIDVSKEELILQCLKSLVISLELIARENNFCLTVIDDHSSSDCVANIKNTLSYCSFPTEFIPLMETGNNASMKFCYEYALTCPENEIYFLEDDYLHHPSCLPEMIDSYQYFQNKMRQMQPKAEVAIMPVDNFFHYIDNAMFSSPVVLGRFRHWRVNYYSNWTLMLSKKGLQDNWANWWKFSDYDLQKPETHEDATLTPIFRNAITLFTPIPSLALHVAGPRYKSPFIKWQDFWSAVDVEWKNFEFKSISEKSPTGEHSL